MMRRAITLASTAAVALVWASSAAQACPDWRLRPPFGAVELVAGFLPDPYGRSVTAGGSYNLANCGFNATGWVAAAPDFDLYYTAGGAPLTFYVNSSYDTVLLISDPNGNWYFDDDSAGNLNPAITFNNPMSGLYDVWIGTYTRGSGLRANLYITEY